MLYNLGKDIGGEIPVQIIFSLYQLLYMTDFYRHWELEAR